MVPISRFCFVRNSVFYILVTIFGIVSGGMGAQLVCRTSSYENMESWKSLSQYKPDLQQDVIDEVPIVTETKRMLRLKEFQ